MRRLLIGLFLIFLLTGGVYAAETSVRSMQTECTVSKDGSCTVLITAEISFAPGTTEFAIPVAPSASDISVGGLKFRRERGAEYALLHLQNDYGFSGTQKLTVSYHLAETVTDGGDHQNFFVTLLYPAWPCPIQRYSFSVQLPEKFDSLPALKSGYYGDLIDNYLDVKISGSEIRAELAKTQTLQDHESMQLSLELPQGYFDLRFLAGKSAKADVLLFLLFFVLCGVWWSLFLRRRPIFARRQAMPPVGSNAGAVPYTLSAKDADLALMVVQWATDGYLTVHRAKNGTIRLEKLIDMDNERKNWEVEVFKTLFRKRSVIDVRGETYRTAKKLASVLAENYYKPRLFVPNAGRPWVLRLFGMLAGMALSLRCFDQLIPPQSWRWLAILPLSLLGGVCCLLVQNLGGCFLRRRTLRTILMGLAGAGFLLVAGRLGGGMSLIAVCILLQGFIGESLRFGGKRTEAGTVSAAEQLGFRRYLRATSAQELQRNLLADPQYFYTTLPWADALCVGRSFAGSFAECRLEPCDWLRWEGRELKYGGQFYARYLRLMAALRGEAAKPAARKQNRMP